MANLIRVTIVDRKEIHALPNDWPSSSLREVLSQADYPDPETVDDADLPDMTAMALQDLGLQAAGECVLEVVFGKQMRPGVRQNLVDDLQEDRPWDDFAEVAMQRGIFTAVSLLHLAFPNHFGTPDALGMQITIEGRNIEPPSPATLLRTLAHGMEGSDLLPRLYESELRSGPFDDASGIVWALEGAQTDAGCLSVTFITSVQWLNPLHPGQSFEVPASLLEQAVAA